VREYADSSKVAFGDVNLSQAPGTGSSWSPGGGGWPTIRYFNSETGYNGAPYVQKTTKSMCDELGDVSYMRAYVEDQSISPCEVSSKTNCSPQEQTFIDTWSSKSNDESSREFARLQKVIESAKTGKTKADQLKWLKQRAAVLQQLIESNNKEL